MTATISTSAKKNLENLVQSSTAGENQGIPGVVAVVVNKNGDELLSHAAGTRGVGSSEPMTLNNIFWIASCTKMIVGIAAMQLVEKGQLHLDDADEAERLAPYLKDVKVLQDDGQLVEKKRRITLRMLLSHTAGFGYSFFNTKLRDFNKPIGYDEFSGNIYDMKQPLVNQPGEAFEYGVNIDWAGVIIENVTNMRLNDYIQKNILQPLDLHNISMFPTKSMKQNLAYMNYKNTDGTYRAEEYWFRRPVYVETEKGIAETFNSGGAGCFAKPQEYAQILAVLLNDGKSAKTGAQILKRETVDEMFRNQISDMPDFARAGIPDAKPYLTNAIPELYPNGEKPQGWGLTFMITGGASGRSDSTGFWAGLPNLWWWCDREKGIAGLVATQILPFVDANVLKLWFGIESIVYKDMQLSNL